MNSDAASMQPQAPSVHVDGNEVGHFYVNTSNIAPSIDECILDLGVSSVAMPPGMDGKPMTPEMAAEMKVVFRHQGRVYMTWPAAKRLARMLSASVLAHEKAFGEIMLLEEREDLTRKAAEVMSGGAPGEDS